MPFVSGMPSPSHRLTHVISLSSSAALSSPPNPNPLRNLVLHDVAQSGWLLEVGGEAGDDREADPQS